MLINGNTPHFVLLPLMAQGHMIPMLDIARLLAARGLVVTILLTPQNHQRLDPVLTRAIASGLIIRVVHITIPLAEVGLPEGSDNLDMLPSNDDWLKFFHAISMIRLRQSVEQVLQELRPPPACFIADMCFTWATNLALKLRVPRIVFLGTSCFSLLCIHMLKTTKNFQDVASKNEYFTIPGFPDKIEMTKCQMIGNLEEVTAEWFEVQQKMFESEDQAFGIVANTFQELEPAYVEEYAKVKGKKVWCIGPVSLCNREDSDKAERGNKASIDQHHCLKWLDSNEPGSVVYVSLGSLTRLSTSQLMELGLGLEGSSRPFVWVIKHETEEFKAWLKEKEFGGRRGLVIQGWAPQMLILSHPSVGAFLTHCGWNSTLEGVTAGLPLITWPVLGDQFHNERLIVNVIKTGVSVGVEIPVMVGQEDSVGVQVKSEDVERAIEEVMDGGEQGRQRRDRARKLGEIAKTAVEEGGSSYRNITLLIQDVIMHQTLQT